MKINFRTLFAGIRSRKNHDQNEAGTTKAVRTYRMLKKGNLESVGIVDGKEYYWMQLCGAIMQETYIRITKEEFNTYEEWSKYPHSAKFKEISSRPAEFNIREVYDGK